MPLKIAIDALGMQAKVHRTWKRSRNARLRTFLDLLEGATADLAVEFHAGRITGQALSGFDLFIDTTRKTRLEDDEVDNLVGFVGQGGGLLIMSNHGPGKCQGARVAARFGIELLGDFYRTLGGTTEIRGDDIVPHPITEGVRHLVTNTTDAIIADASMGLARLPGTMCDRETGEAPRGHLFAVALDADATVNRAGRLVVTADSGFIANPETTAPGPGLIDRGDNARFIRNAVEWLLRRPA